MLTRRHFLMTSVATTTALALPRWARADHHVPVRTITTGPRYHWFGYYDKLEFDPTDRYVLSNEVDFEGRTPTADDVINVGMVDIEDNDRWIELGQSSAWGWQQGCMLQWRPGSESEVVWNDRRDGRFVCHVLDVKTNERRTLPKPIYCLSPDGKWGLGADFARIQDLRPGYGYQGVKDPHRDERAPADAGIYRIDLDTGESQTIVSLADVAKIPYRNKPLTDKWNYFNHLLVSPDGSRFIFLHRWRNYRLDDPAAEGQKNGFVTRMFTANADGSDLYILDPSGNTSHFIWRDPEHICAWTKPDGKKSAFYLFRDRTREVEIVGEEKMPVNGHNTYLPDPHEAWILNDTYPQGENREQTPYLYHVPTKQRVDLGHFHSPQEYTGEWRCDLHPRSSRDGTKVVIDSPHGAQGRQLRLIDVSDVMR